MRCDACGIGTSADAKGTGDIWMAPSSLLRNIRAGRGGVDRSAFSPTPWVYPGLFYFSYTPYGDQ